MLKGTVSYEIAKSNKDNDKFLLAQASLGKPVTVMKVRWN